MKGLPRLPSPLSRLIYMRIATHVILDCERTDLQSSVSAQITRAPTKTFTGAPTVCESTYKTYFPLFLLDGYTPDGLMYLH